MINGGPGYSNDAWAYMEVGYGPLASPNYLHGVGLGVPAPAGSAPDSTPCFAAGTQVVTGFDGDGQAVTKNIEDVKVGDYVLAKDQSNPNDSVEPRRVTAVQVHTVDRLRLLEIQEADGATQTIRTTDEHPFWVKNIGWVKAKDLVAGEELLTPDGREASVLSTSVEEHPEGITVYNLTVEGDHTYFVASTSSEEAVWVHNSEPTNGPAKPGPAPQTVKPPVPRPAWTDVDERVLGNITYLHVYAFGEYLGTYSAPTNNTQLVTQLRLQAEKDAATGGINTGANAGMKGLKVAGSFNPIVNGVNAYNAEDIDHTPLRGKDRVLTAVGAVPAPVMGAVVSKVGRVAGDVIRGEEAAMAAERVVNAEKATAKTSQAFASFDALKRALGAAGEGKAWHHIVEQSQEARFGAEAIHNTVNVVVVPAEVNSRLNALYSSIRPDITGSATLRVREWLSTKSYDEARAFGLKALDNVMKGMW